MGTDINEKVVQWLLQDDEPSVQLRTIKELFDGDDDLPEVQRAKAAVLLSTPVQDLLEKMHPDGYWLQLVPHKKVFVGEGVDYGFFGSTHFCLAYLAELGLDRAPPQVEKAAERYLNLQKPGGGWVT